MSDEWDEVAAIRARNDVLRLAWRGEPCCDLHGHHCEPPSELCCWLCTEVDHPRHPQGVACTWLAVSE